MTHTSQSGPIKAIETRYAGCHFRSRLEARWAVAFDAMRVPWEYEPQGFKVETRLDPSEHRSQFSYLPDFYLPSLELWVEVKGSWSDDQCWRFMNAAAFLSSPGGGCAFSDGHTSNHDTLILGPTRDPDARWRPWRLHMCHGNLLIGDIQNKCVRTDNRKGYTFSIADDVSGRDSVKPSMDVVKTVLLRGNASYSTTDYKWEHGCRAARSARFEHGQSGD